MRVCVGVDVLSADICKLAVRRKRENACLEFFGYHFYTGRRIFLPLSYIFLEPDDFLSPE